MAVCIAGMHRSGTSMIAGLLKQTGVYLGRDRDFLPATEDNPAGFWEHFGFYALNERLLLHLGAGWDMPDLPSGWASRHDLWPFREGACQLIERMRASAEGKAAWGWKDPRNSITIQFWKTLLPEMRVVVCVRNPLAVADSLLRRNNISLAASERLWLRYYQNLLRHVPAEDRVVTLYESYFADPHAELKRVLDELGLPADDQAMTATCGSVDPALHHHHASLEQLLASDCSREVIEIYLHLCNEVVVMEEKLSDRPGRAGNGSFPAASVRGQLQRSRFHAESAQRDEQIRHLTQENATLRQMAEAAQRDEHIRHLTRENAALRQSLDDTRTELRTLTGEMKTLAAHAEANNESVSRLTKVIAAEQDRREVEARRLAAAAARAVVAHQLVAHTRAEFSGLLSDVEGTMKEAAPLTSRLFGHSNAVDSLSRALRRLRRLGAMFKLQRDMNDATTEVLGLLTQLAPVLAGNQPDANVSANQPIGTAERSQSR